MTRLCALLALLLAGGVVAAPVPKDLKAKGPNLEGRWRLVELNLAGSDLAKLNQQEWHIEDGKVTIVRTGNGRREVVTDCGPFRLTSAEADGAVDWVSDEQKPPITSPALARVSGDEFTLVIGEPGKNRPTEFKSSKGVTLYRFERILAK